MRNSLKRIGFFIGAWGVSLEEACCRGKAIVLFVRLPTGGAGASVKEVTA